MKKDYDKVTRQGGDIILDSSKPFGNARLEGMQQKGMINLDGQEVFAKLDSLSPLVMGGWKPHFDYEYSSISESVVSCLVRNMKHDDKFKCTDYKFEIFKHGNNQLTGTISDNFLEPYSDEQILTSSRTDKKLLVDLETYADSIVDKPINQRLDNLIDMFGKALVNPDDAKYFLIQQAGFDVLTGNNDRLNNPSNFIFAQKTLDSKVVTGIPLNADYGRCLQMRTWTHTMEDRYEFDPEYYQDDIYDFGHEMVYTSDAICNSSSLTSSIEFLKANHFKPFEIDMDGLHNDLNDLLNKIQASEIPCQKYAKMKINAFESVLSSPEMSQLWTDTSIKLDLNGLNERGTQLWMSH